ncbi:penicillin-binding transpeptidase domain-containing protein [Clostridium omnivorum]|uniref:Penicillin-binding protein 2 n=1 Tax=Clostridium omnivorum TaxID=1604902 RepID=A0ABQ5N3R4_9CLOT|nr:penicillin-binding transpeptidase domain-containing protein [Clostridium sp. E14]GLC29848.1 penicillin-binding protein 2 [Clostridium sp. E14]
MKTKKYILYIIIIIMALSLAACKKAETPKVSFDGYIAEWQKNDFTAMYKRLSAESKKNISEKDFVDRYKNIYEGINVNKLSVKPTYPEKFSADKDNKVHFPFAVTMDSIAGPIQFTSEVTLVQEKEGKTKKWNIIWNEKMIFPQLEAGDKVKYEKDNFKAKRGEIKDRNGKGLAVNGMTIGVDTGKIQGDKTAFEKQVADILGAVPDQIHKQISVSWAKPGVFVPIAAISKNDIDRLNKLIAIKGVTTQEKGQRAYPYNEAAAHLIGYVGSITPEELEKVKDQGYTKDDLIGKNGLEKVFEKKLKGENGAIVYTTDSKGNKKQTLAQKLPKNGEDITLTIDIDMQQALYTQLNGEPGTAVSVHPVTGEVLAMVSSPAYNPNLFLMGLTDKQWGDLNNNPKKPLTNRFEASFAPGSTFKPVTAAIGLKTSKLDPNKAVNITGKSWQKDSSWGKYSVTRVDESVSNVDLSTALIHSDNIYFAQAALAIGKEDFAKGAADFGIGEKIPFVYPLKASQLTSGTSLDKDIQLADSGYGQAQVSMNPLQLALIYGSLVNGGYVPSPILDMKDKAQNPTIWKDKVISKENSDIIVKDLVQVIENPSGTGHQAQIPGKTIAGKTGTAEIKQSQDDTNGKENGWFVAFDVNNPHLVVLMMIEDVKNKGGSHYAVPKVQAVMQQFLK